MTSVGAQNTKSIINLLSYRLVEDICKIHLGSFNQNDRWIWEHEKSGTFSIQSAYKFFYNLWSKAKGESSKAQSHNSLWKKLWHLKLLPKIKIFAWRTCNDSLPCFKNLHYKKVVRDMHCLLCNYDTEDLGHALLFYPSICNWW